MGTLATDNYNRADNASSWGTASDGTNTWSVLRGTSTFSISSNKGAVANNSGAYCVTQCGSGTSADTDQVVSIKRANSSDLGGLVARVGDANNWYAITLGEYTSNLAFSKFVGGSYTSGVAFGPTTTFAVGTTWNVRFRCIGTSIKARAWDASGAEPSTWDIDTTDSSLSGAKGYGIIADPATGTAMTFDDYNATDGTTTTTNTRTIAATAALLQTSTRTISDTAALLATNTRTIAATAALLSTNTRTIPDDAALLQTSTRTIGASAALELTSIRTIPTSAALELTSTRTIPASTALIATLTRTIPDTAALIGTLTRSIPADAALELTSSRTISTTAALKTINTRTIPNDAALLATLHRTVPCTAALSGISVAPPTNCTFYVRKGNATFYVRKGNSTFYVRDK